ncbi:MAG: YkvA family protein, partial [Xanthobacteraceae bacterium]
AELRQKFWRKVKREAAGIPFLEDALTAYYCAFDRTTPLYVKAILVGAIVYFAVPDDLLPDTLLGLADEAAVLGAAFKLISSHIKPEHRQAAQAMLARLRA